MGAWLPTPLRPWLIGLYTQIDLIDEEKDFLKWLSILDQMPAVYRRSGVPYKIANHWAKAVKSTPMEFFDAATVELKDWRNIFISIDNNDAEPYREFWKWTGPNPYQVRIWLAEVLRKFFNLLMEEHNQLLEKQRNPEGHGQEVEPDEDTGSKPEMPSDLEPEEAESWQEVEQIERKILEREQAEDQQEQKEDRGIRR